MTSIPSVPSVSIVIDFLNQKTPEYIDNVIDSINKIIDNLQEIIDDVNDYQEHDMLEKIDSDSFKFTSNDKELIFQFSNNKNACDSDIGYNNLDIILHHLNKKFDDVDLFFNINIMENYYTLCDTIMASPHHMIYRSVNHEVEMSRYNNEIAMTSYGYKKLPDRVVLLIDYEERCNTMPLHVWYNGVHSDEESDQPDMSIDEILNYIIEDYSSDVERSFIIKWFNIIFNDEMVNKNELYPIIDHIFSLCHQDNVIIEGPRIDNNLLTDNYQNMRDIERFSVGWYVIFTRGDKC